VSVHRLAPNLYRVRLRANTRPDGKRPAISRTVHGTEADAKRLERQLLTKRDKGQLSGKAGQLEQYTDHWYAESLRRGSPATHESNAYLLDTHITPRLGGYKLVAITPMIVRTFHGDLADAGLSGTTARKVANLLSTILDQAMTDGLLFRNPCSSLKKRDRPRVDTQEKRALSADEAQALLCHLLPCLTSYASVMPHMSPERRQQVHDATMFMLGTGVRPGEAMALLWQEVDAKAGVAHVHFNLEAARGRQPRRKKTKGTRRGQRDVPLPPNLIAMLRQHKARQSEYKMRIGRWSEVGYVFPSLDPRKNPGGPWTVQAFRQAWRKLVHGSEFAGLTPYVCRHSYATRLRGLIPDEELSRILGQSSSRVLQSTYSHVDPQTMDRVRDIIAAIL
jgi:integrase